MATSPLGEVYRMIARQAARKHEQPEQPYKFEVVRPSRFDAAALERVELRPMSKEDYHGFAGADPGSWIIYDWCPPGAPPNEVYTLVVGTMFPDPVPIVGVYWESGEEVHWEQLVQLGGLWWVVAEGR